MPAHHQHALARFGDAPVRALDASLVPITLTMPNDGRIKAVSLIIDDNPNDVELALTAQAMADRAFAGK